MKRKKTRQFLVMMLAALISGTSVPFPSLAAETATELPDQASSGKSLRQQYILMAESDLTEVNFPEYIKKVTFADEHTALVRVEPGTEKEDLETDLRAQTRGLQLQANYVYEAAKTDDPYFSLQWGLNNGTGGPDTGFEQVSEFLKENGDQLQETVVAVIDTGFDYYHSDLSANVWINRDEIPGNNRDDDGNGYVDDAYGYDFVNDRNLEIQGSSAQYDHGTHCAGIIAAVSGNGTGVASLAGLTDKVSLMNLRVLSGAEGTGSTFALIQAIQYARDNGADICNLSMGSYAPDGMLYQTMAASDMLFVCAAGNDRLNLDQRPIYPACYDLDHIICVGNADRSGKYNLLSNYSASFVDIAAPGDSIYSTISGDRYGSMSGTSMAAPFVTSAAALLHSYYEGITAEEMIFLLLDGAKTYSSLGGKAAENRFLDAYKPLASYSKEDYHIDKTAPVIQATVSKIKGSYKQKLTVKVSDDSGNLPVVKYSRGSQSKTYFRSGMGVRISLNASGTGTKTLAIPANYTIYARDGAGNDVIYKVKCTADAVNSLKLNYTAKTLKKGKSFTLKATLSKKGTYGRKLTWTSSNKSIATVNSKGKVTAKKKKGTCVITVTTGNGLKKTCKITVK